MKLSELQALADECEAIGRTLKTVPDDAWARPALGEWDLHTLAVHLVRGMGRLEVYLDAETEATAPERDRVSYFRYDPKVVAPGVAQRARQEAANLPPERVAETFDEVWRAAVDRAQDVPADHLMASPFGAMTVREYTATRVLEAVVHHIDVRRALDLPPDSTSVAARMTMDILEGLLGERRPRNFGRNRFILAATGRLEVEDPRFPVLG